jgi:ribonuclease HI
MEIYFDGGCKPNPGMCEAAIVIPSLDLKFHERLSYGTNNQAEWLALLWGMIFAQERGINDITLKGDSQLVLNQAKGVWQCRAPDLQTYLAEFKTMRPKFKRVGLVYVPRAQNLAGQYIEEVN